VWEQPDGRAGGEAGEGGTEMTPLPAQGRELFTLMFTFSFLFNNTSFQNMMMACNPIKTYCQGSFLPENTRIR
jgi:hypothetical protein